MHNHTERCEQGDTDRQLKLTRREALPLLGSLVAAPTILTGCSSPTESKPLWVSGTIAFERRPSYGSDETQRDIYIMDWSAETQINLTADIPGSQGRPFWSPDGTALYFDSVVDGNSFIQRISDLTDPSGSLETIVNEEGHQSNPMLYSDNNLLVYNQTTDLDINTYGAVVAFDMGSGQEISRSETVGRKVLDNNRSSDRAFIPGERKVMCTLMAEAGSQSIGIFDPDTGNIEGLEFDNASSSQEIHSIGVTSDGLIAYGFSVRGSFELYDRVLRWGMQPGERDVERLDSSRAGGKVRANADLIELPEENILLSMYRPGYISSISTPWRIGYTRVGGPSSSSLEIGNTAAFPNMLNSSNYWPRHTFTEHIQSTSIE